MSYFYVLCTILLTVYGQVAIKWQMQKAGPLPEDGGEKIWFLLGLLLDPWIISAYLAALLASLTWMAALSKLDLSYAYPFMSLSFVLVILFSGWLFNEAITTYKVIGIIFIIVGLAFSSQQ